LRSAGQHLANERFRSLTCDRAPFVVLGRRRRLFCFEPAWEGTCSHVTSSFGVCASMSSLLLLFLFFLFYYFVMIFMFFYFHSLLNIRRG
jgi:hypothetical protein